ncbi:MAG: class I SAM-dependent methyltransferase [Chloroflexi bacterium]|nr:MAG: class I SAM-dependent methyltransferase [Chloroflexota bacterium]MBL1193620.1 class I SAM-dependent methyltransferase [Chloroflexota bacterium]NOH10912.1 class I SAM-dependent methyltransferase [Chloroflexota bacterium]
MSESIKYFEEVADDWDEIRSSFFTPEMRDAAIADAQLDPTPEARYADIGTGTGFVVEGLVKTGAKIVGFDESPDMLKVAREKFASQDQISFRQAEGQKLDAQDNSFDAAFANMYLHHAPDPQAAIQEMARILKPGGKLVITDLDTHEQEWMREEMADRWLGFEREDIINWFEASGLSITIDCAEGTCDCTSPSNTDVKLDVFVAIGVKS